MRIFWTDEEHALRRKYESFEEYVENGGVHSFSGWHQKNQQDGRPSPRRKAATPDAPKFEEQIGEVEEHRLKQRNRALTADVRRLLRNKTITEDIVDAIGPIMPRIETAPYPVVVAGDHKHEREMILVLSDVHGYSKATENESGGLIVYDPVKMEAYAARLVHNVASIVAKHGAGIRRLNLFIAGDLIENQIIYAGQLWEISAGTSAQMVGTTSLLIRTIHSLLGSFEEIHVYDVGGNHGRLTPKREAAPPNENLDWAIVRFVQNSLELMSDRVIFHESESWFRLVERMGYRFLMIHGHQIRSWGGSPQNAIMRNAGEFFKMITDALPPDVPGGGFQYMILGHFHTRAWMEATGYEVFVNGPWPGGSSYSTQELKASSRPAQQLIVLHPEHGVTECFPIYLADRSELPTVEIDRE